MKAVIMAGGKGTRISAIASDIPKPMLPIAGKPVLEHEITCLQGQGFHDIIVTVSHLAEHIMRYFRDGDGLGVKIEYYVELEPLGNAGALFRIRDRLNGDFLLLNADALFCVDLKRFVAYHRSKGGLVTIFTHPNNHPYDSGVIISGEDGTVSRWLTSEDDRPEWYPNRVNAGLHIINTAVLDRQELGALSAAASAQKVDLDRQILKPLCGTGQMFCYDSPEYVKDMGTPKRYETVCRDFEVGLVRQKSLRNRQRAVFLDRDGTINRYMGFLKNIGDFELLPGVAEAIRKINGSGFLVIIVTNQPVIARGELSFDGLRSIHDKMETLLGREGAYVDAIYYCPHHPDSGYEGEIPELKVDCCCRKPKPGMLLKAADEFNIDLAQSWMVGDSESDIKAGNAAGCRTAFIGMGNFGQTMTVESLPDFIERVGL